MINLGKFTPNGKEVILYQLDNECMECISHCKDTNGYTLIFYNGKLKRLHRAIYEKFYGNISEGKVIRHSCDNPYCCNIKHLIVGSQQDNVNDMWERNRQRDYTKNNCNGENNGSYKLTELEIKDIYLSNLSCNKLSKKYNVSKTNIYYIKHKLNWKWYTDKLDNIRR